MSNYNQQTVSGESWTRAKEVSFRNPLGRNPSVIFHEEDALILGDKTQTIQTNSKIHRIMTAENAATEFNLVNPLDGTTFGTATYQEVQAMLYSLYLYLAELRDNPPVVEPEPVEDEPEP